MSNRLEALLLVVTVAMAAGAAGHWMGQEEAREFERHLDQAWSLGWGVGERCNDAVRPANVTWDDCAAILTGANVMEEEPEGST